MFRKLRWGIGFLILTVVLFAAGMRLQEPSDLTDFEPLFNGNSLEGWRKLSEYSGDDGSWKVVDGEIVGMQYPEGKGGLLVTEKKYRDFELYADVNHRHKLLIF